MGGEVSGADDTGIVQELRGNNGGINLDEGEKLVALLADATADHENVGAEVVLQQLVILGQPLAPFLPGQFLGGTGGISAILLGVLAIKNQVA